MIRRVAVVGAAGRIGQWVTRDLVAWGYQVRAVDRVTPAPGGVAGAVAASAARGPVDVSAARGPVGPAGVPDDPWQGVAGQLQADVTDRAAAEAAVADAGAVVFVAGLPCGPMGRSAAGAGPADDGAGAAARDGGAASARAVAAVGAAACTGAAGGVDPAAALGGIVQALWQTAAAAGRAGVERFVLASSIGVYGLNRAGQPWQPLYFPIDERHPVQPQDLAGLAHWLQEQALAQLAREHGFAAVCLRLPQVILPSGYAALRERQSDAALGYPGLWTYLDVRDAARAMRLALETPEQLLAEAMGGDRLGRAGGGQVALNVVAATSTSPRPTTELLAEFFPDVPVQSARLPGQAPAVTGDRAAKALGFTPRYGWIGHGG